MASVVLGSAPEANTLAIDLFAGCGGLSLGLHAAGWQGLFAVEKDPTAFETLERNLLDTDATYRGYEHWPDWVPRAPSDLDVPLAGDSFCTHLEGLNERVDLVAGGPPSRGFSAGGARNVHEPPWHAGYSALKPTGA
jgi:DNA (cytosine-5)-methyltransferase 1